MLYFVLAFVFIFIMFFYINCTNFFKAFLIGTLSGLIFMALIGVFLPNYMSFNFYTILFSAINGIPGVLLMILYNVFLI